MGQASPWLRNTEYGYSHWCPACLEMHPLFTDGWTFNGNVDKPSFTPSFLHNGLKRIFKDGQWTGEWELDQNKNPIKYVCHYILTDGILNFCGDCTHALSGQKVPLPLLPDYYRD